MSGPLLLFAYDFPHRKTQDFLYECLASGARDIVVVGAPRRELGLGDSHVYYPSRLRRARPIDTRELCARLGVAYHVLQHDDEAGLRALVQQHGCKVGVVAGARILRKEIIALFEEGVVNFHPGKVPETSGLDSFFHMIDKGAPAGVTVHYIDHRVDAGRLLWFEPSVVGPEDDPEAVVEGIYQAQLTALRKLLPQLQAGPVTSTEINRPSKNSAMTPEEKLQALAWFGQWRARQVLAQQGVALRAACEKGDLKQVRSLLRHAGDPLLETPNAQGWTPLVIAAFNQHADVVDYLLALGANPNAQGSKGTTVLMYAKTRLLNQPGARYALLARLIDAGAEVGRPDRHGRTILDYVADAGDDAMVTYLRERMNQA